MRNLLYLIGATVVLLLCGCHRRDSAWQTLDVAESIMESHPDSALALLTAIDGRALTGETQARHALLLSHAYNKNYIDETDDSLISIAVNYYDSTNDLRNQMRSHYFLAFICSNQQDYARALSEALSAERLAVRLDDRDYLARTKMLIARAYLFSYNLEGAEEYFEQTRSLCLASRKRDWIGLIYYNLSNLELYKENYTRALEYIDSAKTYRPINENVLAVEVFAHIGLGQYHDVDSICNLHQALASATPQVRAYQQLSRFYLEGRTVGAEFDYDRLFDNATHFDSLDIAFVANSIALANGDFRRAWEFTEFLRKEADNVISDLSEHSLYRIQIEHDKHQKQLLAEELQTRKRLNILYVAIAVLLGALSCMYILFLKRAQKARLLEVRQNLLLVSSALADSRLEIGKYQAIKDSDSSTIHTLQQQVRTVKLAARELFVDKYSWIEEMGNIMLDAEVSKTAGTHALKKIRNRLEATQSAQFLPQLIDIINRYRDGLITRILTSCPSISETERNIIALLCANLSTRVISFILGIKPQSVYNAKSAIKKKIETANPGLLREMTDIFPHN